MISRPTTSLLSCLLGLPAVLLLSACTTLDPGAHRDPALADLGDSMAQCLSNQASTLELLQQQQDQLDQLQKQQQTLTGEIRATDKAGDNVAAPPDNACAGPGELRDKLLVGQLETVWLQNLQLALTARIDTGAETSSLDARNIEPFERNGRRWVRFDIVLPETGELLPVERRLKRMVAIVQSNTTESERRPVIVMGITIGSIAQTAEFTLSNRSHLDYQVLVGRNILKDVMVVDVSRENIVPLAVPRTPKSGGTAP